MFKTAKKRNIGTPVTMTAVAGATKVHLACGRSFHSSCRSLESTTRDGSPFLLSCKSTWNPQKMAMFRPSDPRKLKSVNGFHVSLRHHSRCLQWRLPHSGFGAIPYLGRIRKELSARTNREARGEEVAQGIIAQKVGHLGVLKSATL